MKSTVPRISPGRPKTPDWPGSGLTCRIVKHIRILTLLLVFSLVAAACGGDEEAAPSSTTLTTLPPITEAPTTSTSSSSTTTTITPGAPSVLNGMPTDLDADLDRRVVAVKVDNHPDARPQSGIQDADAVIELIVEAGITRFIAMFNESDSEYIGPIRSGRPTDPTLLKSTGGTFQISGAQPWVQGLINSAGVPFLGETSPNTFRIPQGARAYERTLYASSPGIREAADTRGYSDDPPADDSWFTFGDPPANTEDAELVHLSWSGNWPTVNWEWDGEQYVRFNAETPHEWITQDGEAEQMSTDTLLVLTADQYTASGSSGSAVPALHTTGEGQVYLFQDGSVAEGTWKRETIDEWFELTTVDGDAMAIPAGRLWFNMFPDDRPVTWE